MKGVSRRILLESKKCNNWKQSAKGNGGEGGDEGVGSGEGDREGGGGI